MASKNDKKYLSCTRPPTCMYCGKNGNEKDHESSECPSKYKRDEYYCCLCEEMGHYISEKGKCRKYEIELDEKNLLAGNLDTRVKEIKEKNDQIKRRLGGQLLMAKLTNMSTYDPNDFTKLAGEIFDKSAMNEYKLRFINYTNKKLNDQLTSSCIVSDEEGQEENRNKQNGSGVNKSVNDKSGANKTGNEAIDVNKTGDVEMGAEHVVKLTGANNTGEHIE
jgi:hypothetical protein